MLNVALLCEIIKPHM